MSDINEKNLKNIIANKKDVSRIIKVFVFIFIFTCIELWGHYYTRSLSLLADALHLVIDLSGLVVSIITLKIASRKTSKSYTFGYQRFEVLGALVSILMIWFAVIYLIMESIDKYRNPHEITGNVFFLIAVIGMIVNIVCMKILHSHSHRNGETGRSTTNSCKKDLSESYCGHEGECSKKGFNVRATTIHMVGDLIQSVGVIIASGIIWINPNLVVADVICTIFFAILTLGTTVMILKDLIHILAEGSPGGIDQDKIISYVTSFPEVVEIKTMRLWSISRKQDIIILKIVIRDSCLAEYERLYRDIYDYLERKYGFWEIAIEIRAREETEFSGTKIQECSIINMDTKD